MASITTRDSVLALVVESTEGTPVAATSTGEYISLQPDADMSPSFDVLENEELKGSIGPSKAVLGFENPTFSMSHYLRHSGSEGVSCDIHEILKAAFGNAEIESTEYNTIAGSSVSVVKVDSAEGANYRKGQPLLVKDSTNGYSVVPVDSISSDDLTLGFNLANAPAVGVDLGKAIIFYPAQSGHQSLSAWMFVGDGGATQLVSGCKVTEFSFDISAGEMINSNFSMEGIKYYFNPIEIASADTYIDFTDDTGTYAAQITAQMYTDPHELAAAIQTAMDGLTAETITCVYSDSTGKFTIATSTSTIFSLLWNSGTNSSNTAGDKIGFTVGSDDTGSTSYTSDSAISFAAPQEGAYDSQEPLVAKDNVLYIGDATDNTCFAASSLSFSMTNGRRTIDSICASSGRSGSIFNSREVTVSFTALLDKYDVDKFKRFRANTDTKLFWVGGTKSGGNWVPGTCISLYLGTATITSFKISDDDGLASLEGEVKAFVNGDSEDEVVLGMI